MMHQEQIATVSRLRSFHAKDHEERLAAALRHWIADPVRPKTDKGNLRVNPLLILLTVMAALTGGTFLFFSLGQL